MDCETLVLGRMPREATPLTHRAAGPWCFAEQEDAFPHWETDFSFAPEPLANRELQAQACADAKALCATTLPRIVARLWPQGKNLPDAYWETLLTPWVMAVARQIVERWWRVRAMVRAWGNETLHVPLLPADSSFAFASVQDFIMHGALGHDWNHWLLSRLLESVFPPAWIKGDLPPVHRQYASKAAPSIKSRLRKTARRLVLTLPFPPLKGMRLTQALRYSLCLLHRSHGPDRSTPLKFYAGTPIDEAARPPLDTLPLFLGTLPHDLAVLRHPDRLTPDPLGPRLRVGTILAYENAEYRQSLAIWRGRGNRLMYVQHGGNYGQARIVCDMELVEYCQHAFGTWGWTRQGLCRGNFLPVPYPQLALETHPAVHRERQAPDNRSLLMVGTEMPAFPYRLDSLPTPLQTLLYRRDKAVFLEYLPEEILKKVVYRPYFPVPGTLRDAEWLLERFPQIRKAEGNLKTHLDRCRLLILDHNGTSLLEAFAANRPVLAFWRRDHWPLTEEAEALLDMLAKAGIWYPTPKAAAAAVKDIWDAPEDWWKCAEIQQARSKYCACQALRMPDSPDPYWGQLLKRL